MKLTWLGHATFHLDFAGKSILVDPFLNGNPKYPTGWVDRLARIDAIALTHGHGDHYGDTLELAQRFDCPVAAMYEIAMYLGEQGYQKLEPMNIGGAVHVGDVRVTMVNALHSSALILEGKPVTMGNPAGLIFEGPGEKTVYHAGDTDLFSDMQLIQRLYQPSIGLIPCGDRFTMGPQHAAVACNEFLDLETIVPTHWGTFDLLPGDPAVMRDRVQRGSVRIAEPGETLSL